MSTSLVPHAGAMAITTHAPATTAAAARARAGAIAFDRFRYFIINWHPTNPKRERTEPHTGSATQGGRESLNRHRYACCRRARPGGSAVDDLSDNRLGEDAFAYAD